MIHREQLVKAYNPILESIDISSPMTIGNGNFAFTADVTGLQTLYDDYLDGCPTLTMSNWGWHIAPDQNNQTYTLDDLSFTKYTYNGREVSYPVKPQRGEGEVYDWLRENPHRFNLFRLRFFCDGKVLAKEIISNIHQELDLYTGILKSRFFVEGEEVKVTCMVAEEDCVGFHIESKLLKDRLSVCLDFPYGAPSISGSDFTKTQKHSSAAMVMNQNRETRIKFSREMDNIKYYVFLLGNIEVQEIKEHTFSMFPKQASSDSIQFTLSVTNFKEELLLLNYQKAMESSKHRFYFYWNGGGMIDVSSSTHPKANELQRRIILSQYLLFIQSAGNIPPQETGLTCNSWYGKFHLEMHPIHAAFLSLYGHGKILEKSFAWYEAHLTDAKENARRNGYMGARWPKMVGPEGKDSPSVIAPLLCWQQPHLLYMLELIRLSRYSDFRVEVVHEKEIEFLRKYKDLVLETALFMEDFVVYNEEKEVYELVAPLIPVQENHAPEDVLNPAFETAYWSFGLEVAYAWMEKLGEKHPKWIEISKHMAKPPIKNHLLEAHENTKKTYTKFSKDHPSMLFIKGFLNEDVPDTVMKNSLTVMEEVWDKNSLWGWDFAFLSMSYAKLGDMEKAYETLLWETEKNTYVKSGNNAQASRKDLPLYLPGNGSLLLALTLLENTREWYIEKEGILSYPF